MKENQTPPAVFTIVEEDLQMVAMQTVARRLSPDELRRAARYFENGISEYWYDLAECAVDLTVQETAGT